MHKNNLKLIPARFQLFLIITGFTLLVSCGDDDDDNDDDAPVELVTRSIIGTWDAWEDGFSCKDKWVYNADNTFTCNSNQEIWTGTYVFETETEVGSDPKLTVFIETDNVLVDCHDGVIDESENQFTVLVEFENDSVATWSAAGLSNPKNFVKR